MNTKNLPGLYPMKEQTMSEMLRMSRECQLSQNISTLNELRDEIHENAVKRGFYDKVTEGFTVDIKTLKHAFVGQQIAFIHSGLSEVLEADRKEKHADMKGWADFEKRCPEIEFSKENHAAIFRSNFRGKIKDTVENELADVVMRTLDLCAYLEIDIEKHIDLKMKYNKLKINSNEQTD